MDDYEGRSRAGRRLHRSCNVLWIHVNVVIDAMHNGAPEST